MPRKTYTMKMVEDKRGKCFGIPIWIVILVVIIVLVIAIS